MKWLLFFFPVVLLLGLSPFSLSDNFSSGPYGKEKNPPVWKLKNFMVPGLSFSGSSENSYSPTRVFVNELFSGVPSSRGSGFFVGPNLVITNLHVISRFFPIPLMLRKDHLMNPLYSFQFGRGFTRLERNGRSISIKRIVRLSSALDLALLETTTPVDAYLPVETTPLAPTENAWIYGYPERMTPAKAIGKIGDAIHFHGGGLWFLTDYQVSLSGVSGSPILDHQGKVRGVLYMGVFNFAMAITGQDLKDFIDGNLGVDCDSDNPKECVKQDEEKLLQSAEEGDMLSQRRLGFLLHRRSGSSREAQKWLERAARQNDPIAQYVMGTIDRKGRKLHWFSQAVAHEGFTPAKHELADFLLKTTKQRERAFQLLSESAEAGYRPSLQKLNKMGVVTSLTDPLSRIRFNLAVMRNKCYSFFR